jgi:hypothetical protein
MISCTGDSILFCTRSACIWMIIWVQMHKGHNVLGRKLKIGHHILYTCSMSVVVALAPSMIKESNPAKSVETYNTSPSVIFFY